MTGVLSTRIRMGASTASHIASLCHYLAEALGSAPETSVAGEAVEGLQELASRLANDLHDIAEDAA